MMEFMWFVLFVVMLLLLAAIGLVADRLRAGVEALLLLGAAVRSLNETMENQAQRAPAVTDRAPEVRTGNGRKEWKR